MGYSVVNVDRIEPTNRDGTVRLIRRELGVEAFAPSSVDATPILVARRNAGVTGS